MDKVTAEKVLNITDNPYTKDILQKCYKSAVKKVHPDCGGSHEQMVQVNEAHTYLLSYFKYQSSVSLSSVTYNITSDYDFLNDYQKRVNEREERRKEAKRAYVRRVSEEIRNAAEKMKEEASATETTAESFRDFAKAYEDFVYWTSETGDSPDVQWAKVNQVVDEIRWTKINQIIDETKKETEKVQKAIFKDSIAAIAIICLRILLVVIAAWIFVHFSGVDFILNIGTFHFFDLYQGTPIEFLISIDLLIFSIFNLWKGYFTDWITSVWIIIEEKISSARERRKMS